MSGLARAARLPTAASRPARAAAPSSALAAASQVGPAAASRAITALVSLGALALALASCAPLPPPGTLPAPPAGGAPRSPVTRPPGPYRLDHEPMIDVGLGADFDTLSLEPQREVTLAIASGGIETRLASTRGVVVARLADEGFTVIWRSGSGRPETRMSFGRSDTAWVGSDEASDASGIRWLGKTWRGRLKLFVSPRGKITLATRVPLETYLLGVVPAEIGGLAAELLEAGRAQAIAARSYTLFYQGRRGTEGFDLYGSVEDQVYGSIENERPLATQCVESTRGSVAIARTGPIRANYYSTCGGITADVWEAWPADPLPYLVSHRDHGAGRDYCADSPVYRWREEWSAADFLANLATYGPAEGITPPPSGWGDLLDVRVTSRSHSGRVWRFSIRTSTGSFEVPGQALRRVLRRPGPARAILRSNLVKIDVRRDRVTRRASAVVASGAGSGHGVGLCQTGAIGMARAGIPADRILLHYYSGVEIKRFY